VVLRSAEKSLARCLYLISLSDSGKIAHVSAGATSASADRTTVAVAQMRAELGDAARNVGLARAAMRRAAEGGATLVVMPECALSGYMHDSRAEVEAAAVSLDGPEIAALLADCARYALHCVVGLLERDDDHVFNAAALLGPSGIVGVHRKRHLPFLGADRFVDRSDDVEPSVFATPIGNVGIAICYEIRFPEAIRTLALAGADIVALPTNWAPASAMLANDFTRVRAAENFVWLLVANRCDRERDIAFMGASQIVDPRGVVVAHGADDEGVVCAEVDVAAAREKSIIVRAGEFELFPWRDRRPDSYRL